MNTSYRQINKSRQRGATLIVGMIMLLLLTLIGVAGMQDTLLQEKMAGNARDRDMALQAAEAALRDAEIVMGAATEPVFNNVNGMYDWSASMGYSKMKRQMGSSNFLSEQAFWQTQWNWASPSDGGILYSRALPDVAEQPKYVIEKLPVSMTDKTQYAGGTDPNYVEDITGNAEVPEVPTYTDYRITARGVGLTADSVVILQSTFRRRPN